MNKVPETPSECPICQRVEQALKNAPELKERLSENEIEGLVKKTQYAVLNKDIINKGGTKMSDEKYVISKASFEDFYETQDNLVSIIAKMVNRIETQDKVMMKFGAALSELIADKQPEFSEEEEGVEDEAMGAEEVEGEEAPIEGAENLEDEDLIEEEVGEEEEVPAAEVEEEEAPMEDEGMKALLGKAQKDAFEAGWKAHEAELKKQNGIPAQPAELSSNGIRPVPTADVQVAAAAGQVKKSLTDAELARLTPQQVNAWLKEQGF